MAAVVAPSHIIKPGTPGGRQGLPASRSFCLNLLSRVVGRNNNNPNAATIFAEVSPSLVGPF
jgi:hypothetical protein